jgi:hypothetical protein
MTSKHYIEEADLSVAWAKALRLACANGREVAPLIVSVVAQEDGSIRETPSIRSEIEAVLKTAKKQSVETVAGTIFPQSLWNPKAPRAQLFDRYTRILPKLKTANKLNRNGMYFERMIDGGPSAQPNQLEHIIATFTERSGVRRSMLQVATFDPKVDHSREARKMFPCLQHVTFAPSEGALNINAFYATQFLVERGYGNYLGLCRLGTFVAHELGLPLGRLTCLVGVAQCELSKGKLAGVLSALGKIETA